MRNGRYEIRRRTTGEKREVGGGFHRHFYPQKQPNDTERGRTPPSQLSSTFRLLPLGQPQTKSIVVVKFEGWRQSEKQRNEEILHTDSQTCFEKGLLIVDVRSSPTSLAAVHLRHDASVCLLLFEN